ncbi:5-formyltetrahydrofolate cyclo-ligase [Undibacterium sp. Jales W-56]|uniref:5-formyltetrahydrofolate cyclo-ligase n=1 Tax=Undibacterium sp. Jales W-56 TaxID=2897325 RepID=UPI0021D11343|nr:5-formyltetrahydrofolate cyclo-ligase [Undibacterium sp. Jales W-56]MCU6432236.1 5-formyltetrahydrofolate cyclo-ligase [Undibacterium sp. Jales W-56]
MTQPTQQTSLSAQNTANSAAQISRSRLRKQLLDARRASAVEDRAIWDRQIGQQVIAWCRQQQIKSLGVFWPIQAEPDLRDCYAQLHQMKVQLALPLVPGKDQALQFLRWVPGDAMGQDDYGIPVPAQRSQWMQPEALLIPCVGFNSDNYRLGYGGGFYDRTLAIAPRPKAVGIAYSLAHAEFAADTHDVAMDRVLTEKI